MKAELVIHNKVYDENGNIVEVKMWKVKPTKDKPHGYKYSLAYIVNGKRVIGYDNAECKGDHRHFYETIERYEFVRIDKLADDFYKDIQKYKKEHK